MARKIALLFTCIAFLATGTIALAGGAPALHKPMAQPCAPAPVPYGAKAPGAKSAYWGDAPFPGMCGGVVALPFLVVGSFLGGNPAAPAPYGPPAAYGPPPAPGYMPPPVKAGACPPPRALPPQAACGPGPAYAGPAALAGGPALGGIPCLDLCYGLLGSVTGGTGLFY